MNKVPLLAFVFFLSAISLASATSILIYDTDPMDKTVQLVNELYDNPEEMRVAEDVSFREHYILSAAAIAEGVPLSREQFCMSLGGFEGSDAFELEKRETYQRILYKVRGQSLYVDIGVVCNASSQQLLEGLKGTKLEEYDADCSICEGQGRCCLIWLEESEAQARQAATGIISQLIGAGAIVAFIVFIVWFFRLKEKSRVKQIIDLLLAISLLLVLLQAALFWQAAIVPIAIFLLQLFITRKFAEKTTITKAVSIIAIFLQISYFLIILFTIMAIMV